MTLEGPSETPRSSARVEASTGRQVRAKSANAQRREAGSPQPTGRGRRHLGAQFGVVLGPLRGGRPQAEHEERGGGRAERGEAVRVGCGNASRPSPRPGRRAASSSERRNPPEAGDGLWTRPPEVGIPGTPHPVPLLALYPVECLAPSPSLHWVTAPADLRTPSLSRAPGNQIFPPRGPRRRGRAKPDPHALPSLPLALALPLPFVFVRWADSHEGRPRAAPPLRCASTAARSGLTFPSLPSSRVARLGRAVQRRILSSAYSGR